MKIVRAEELTTFPELRELTPEELAEGYALYKASFTAADLQKYTETDEGVLADDVLREMDEAQKKFDEQQPQ